MVCQCCRMVPEWYIAFLSYVSVAEWFLSDKPFLMACECCRIVPEWCNLKKKDWLIIDVDLSSEFVYM